MTLEGTVVNGMIVLERGRGSPKGYGCAGTWRRTTTSTPAGALRPGKGTGDPAGVAGRRESGTGNAL